VTGPTPARSEGCWPAGVVDPACVRACVRACVAPAAGCWLAGCWLAGWLQVRAAVVGGDGAEEQQRREELGSLKQSLVELVRVRTLKPRRFGVEAGGDGDGGGGGGARCVVNGCDAVAHWGWEDDRADKAADWADPYSHCAAPATAPPPRHTCAPHCSASLRGVRVCGRDQRCVLRLPRACYAPM
jgi:hypothetical protein